MTRYKVSRPGGRWAYFATLELALAFAGRVYRRSGNVVAVEAVR